MKAQKIFTMVETDMGIRKLKHKFKGVQSIKNTRK